MIDTVILNPDLDQTVEIPSLLADRGDLQADAGVVFRILQPVICLDSFK